MGKNKKPLIDMEEMDKYLRGVDLDATKRSVDEEIKKLQSRKDQFMNEMSCEDNIKEIIMDKIVSIPLDVLNKKLNNNSFVESIFEHEGESITFNMEFKSNADEIEFKRSFISWIATSEYSMKQIEKQFEEYQSQIGELKVDLDDAVYVLSDKLLNYIQYMKDSANKTGNAEHIAEVMKITKYMESAYNMTVFKEVVLEHPSVVKNTLSDLNSETRIAAIGKRYTDKLQSVNIHANLVKFISNEKTASFEALHLLREDYEIEDLFIFSLIRYFSMADWSNRNIRRMHATVFLVLKQIYDNSFDIKIRKDILESIKEYIALFK